MNADADRHFFKSQIVFIDQFLKFDLFRRSINDSCLYYLLHEYIGYGAYRGLYINQKL